MEKTNLVKPSVRLKGVGDGLCVSVDPTVSKDLLLEELNRLFKPMKNLSSNTRVTLDMGDEDGNEGLADEIGSFLSERFGIQPASKLAKKRSLWTDRIRQRDMDHSWQNYRSDVLMLAGRVRSGQKVNYRNHLIIMGDVNPGAEVLAGGDIVVIGSLCGTAVAGQPDNEDSIILALDFRPTQIQIGSLVAAGLPDSTGHEIEYAHVENGAIVVEDYLENNPFGKLPWPKVR